MTAQVAEVLLYKNKKIPLLDEPLHYYPLEFNFQKNKKEIQWTNTACWRGYVGTWKITNKKLYLVDILGAYGDGSKMVIDDIEPATNQGVFAWWLSRELRCGLGRIINYVHGGYMSTFEKDLFLTFDRGILVSERIVENKIEPNLDDPDNFEIPAFLRKIED